MKKGAGLGVDRLVGPGSGSLPLTQVYIQVSSWKLSSGSKPVLCLCSPQRGGPGREDPGERGPGPAGRGGPEHVPGLSLVLTAGGGARMLGRRQTALQQNQGLLQRGVGGLGPGTAGPSSAGMAALPLPPYCALACRPGPAALAWSPRLVASGAAPCPASSPLPVPLLPASWPAPSLWGQHQPSRQVARRGPSHRNSRAFPLRTRSADLWPGPGQAVSQAPGQCRACCPREPCVPRPAL